MTKDEKQFCDEISAMEAGIDCKWNIMISIPFFLVYATSCGKHFSYNNIVDNDFLYCPYCGNEIELGD